MQLRQFIKRQLNVNNRGRARIISRCIHDLAQTFNTPKLCPISIEEIKSTLIDIGIATGDTIHLHSSISFLYRGGLSFSKTPPERPLIYANKIINTLIDIVGPDGTILMNTDSIPMETKREIWTNNSDAFVFDYARSPSRRGLLSELFRRRKDTIRSLHPWYNITAWGKRAQELIGEHEQSTPYTMDVHSPWYKLMASGGKVVLLGKTFDVNSFIHLVEYLHPDEFPRPVFLNKPVTMKYFDRQRQIKKIEVMLHARVWRNGAHTLFAEYLNEKYNIYKIRKFRDDVQIVSFVAKDEFDAIYHEMKNDITWYDTRFLP
jgi:aminoglycoside N3'-acetyltransferase